MDEQPSVKITLDMIYAKQVKTSEDVAELRHEIKDIRDHETRIRSLERRVWAFTGLAGTVGGTITAIASHLFGVTP